MGDQPISEIVGRHEAAPETGATEATATAAAEQAATGETSAASAPAEAPDPVAGLKSALDKERERASRFEKDFKKSERARQQEAASLRRELEALRAAAPRPDPKAIEDQFWSSEGGPPQFIDQRLSAFEQRQQAAIIQERVELSKELARDKYEDFEEAEAAFTEAAEKDPTLWNGVLDRRLPAIEVYKRGKKIMSGAETAPDTRIAKLEAEIAALKAGRDGGQTEAATETVTAPAKKPQIPKSNVGVRSSGVGKSSSWAGPTPIDNVFGRQRSAR